MTSCVGAPAEPTWTPSNHAGYNGNAALTTEVDNCSAGGRFEIRANTTNTAPKGSGGQWSTAVPPAMALTSVTVPAQAVLLNPSTNNGGGTFGYQARYLWDGGSSNLVPAGNCCGGMDFAAPISQPIQGQYFIVQVTCNGASNADPTCELPVNGSAEAVDLKDITLTAADVTPPTITVPSSAGGGTNLWDAGHFVRGSFELAYSTANAAGSGVCNEQASINGAALPTVVASAPNTSTWVQCPATSSWSQSVDTTAYPNGPMSVTLTASDAASPANVATESQSTVVDNAPVTVALSGPTAVLSTAGTQYVSASATAGPSGVAAIFCNVDGGSIQRYAGASAQIPVSGIGPHTVSCSAQNNALDASGTPASSPTQTYTVDIQQPTAAAITFGKEVDPLQCHRVTQRIAKPGTPHTVTRHGKKVRVRGKGRVVTKRVERCHARTARRRVVVTVTRHGKKVRVKRVERVVLLPHTVDQPKLTVKHGQGARVSGVLLLSGGTAAAGQPVEILAAPDNSLGQFAPVAAVTTDVHGAWSAKLPAGPSRLVEAAYAGSPTTAPAVSTPISLTVPAKISIVSVTPRHVAWGHKVTIVGQLSGGYLPPKGALVRLKIMYGKATTTYGVKEHVTGTGRFTAHYTFGASPAAVHRTYAFQIASLPTGDYPFSPADSEAVEVYVGGHP